MQYRFEIPIVPGGGLPAGDDRSTHCQPGPADPLDRARLAALLRGTAQTAPVLLAEFQRALDADAQRLLDACGAGDCAHVEQLAHRIEGASKVIGAAAVGQACRLVAQAARLGWPGTLRAAVNVFLRRKDALDVWLLAHHREMLPGDAGDPGNAICAGLVFLVVEDHGFQRQMIMRMLRQLGALEVHGFADGASALAAARRLSSPAILLLDLALPEIDGVEVMRIAAHEKLALSVIVHSAREPDLLDCSLQTARSYGASVLGAVSKPLTASKLAPLLAPLRHGARAVAANAVPGASLHAATTAQGASARQSTAAPRADAP